MEQAKIMIDNSIHITGNNYGQIVATGKAAYLNNLLQSKDSEIETLKRYNAFLEHQIQMLQTLILEHRGTRGIFERVQGKRGTNSIKGKVAEK